MLVVTALVVAGFASAAAVFFVVPDRLVDDARFADAATNPATEQKPVEAAALIVVVRQRAHRVVERAKVRSPIA